MWLTNGRLFRVGFHGCIVMVLHHGRPWTMVHVAAMFDGLDFVKFGGGGRRCQSFFSREYQIYSVDFGVNVFALECGYYSSTKHSRDCRTHQRHAVDMHGKYGALSVNPNPIQTTVGQLIMRPLLQCIIAGILDFACEILSRASQSGIFNADHIGG